MHTVEERAHRYARKAHAEAGQRRKYTDEPYIVHPAAVVALVRSVSHNEEMLAAAWLHDTVEDTASTLNDIRRHFGGTIASLVEMLTNRGDTAGQSRIARKIAHFRHTQQASPAAQTIKLADIIDNTRSIIHYDPQFARVYLVEKRVQIALLTAGNAALLQQAKQIAEQSIRQLGQPPHNVPASWFERQEAKYRQAINAAAGNASYS
ncbi:HD domain-containing protein [Erwinia amylovora]|uniref:Metal dependent phosphohydrolase n=3 Tax=Erwinia amylovora TaxID=552 RepID=A0A831A5L7_ERWAM|nr:HD domain-containing protein [Erwinia amylovora]CDK16911.1 metal dependent phosphohydrolase [Erwinia amylovora LA635]CDK20279.1 metal dependent phosphohydrolase [Erwinia amylovora LA636]CDK23650.1 metal dependent phosphohydrolase [Erwinia amylovora LA637]ATZ13123.1 bifunctional (p)ppGpp synthetase/guanosine-3',5'-bis(diphosphate) 3'-pyrophosphohydrolase [Erwinia amylovora]EKV52275.1 metal dependent phosphohydrolase [Erwinia amylovora ACW56400]